MRTTYLLAYDISDPARLRKVHKLVDAYGDRIQLSVYRCALTPKEKVLLVGGLRDHLNTKEDRVILVSLGPTGGRQVPMETLGVPLTPESQGDVIL